VGGLQDKLKATLTSMRKDAVDAAKTAEHLTLTIDMTPVGLSIRTRLHFPTGGSAQTVTKNLADAAPKPDDLVYFSDRSILSAMASFDLAKIKPLLAEAALQPVPPSTEWKDPSHFMQVAASLAGPEYFNSLNAPFGVNVSMAISPTTPSPIGNLQPFM